MPAGPGSSPTRPDPCSRFLDLMTHSLSRFERTLVQAATSVWRKTIFFFFLCMVSIQNTGNGLPSMLRDSFIIFYGKSLTRWKPGMMSGWVW